MATLLSQAPRAPLSCRAPLLRRRRSAAHVGKGVVTVSSSECGATLLGSGLCCLLRARRSCFGPTQQTHEGKA